MSTRGTEIYERLHADIMADVRPHFFEAKSRFFGEPSPPEVAEQVYKYNMYLIVSIVTRDVWLKLTKLALKRGGTVTHSVAMKKLWRIWCSHIVVSKADRDVLWQSVLKAMFTPDRFPAALWHCLYTDVSVSSTPEGLHFVLLPSDTESQTAP